MSLKQPIELENHLLAQQESRSQMEIFFWHRLRSCYVAKRLSRYVISSPSLLDMGAGVGIFGTHLGKLIPDAKYFFQEPLPLLAQGLCKQFGNDREWKKQNFHGIDVVVMLDVLEHIENDTEFLKDLFSKMQKGSVLVLTCPALSILWSDWDVKLGHFRRYSSDSFRNVLEGAGFTICELGYLFQAMILPGLLRKTSKNQQSEFPRVPKLINELIYQCGKVEQLLCGFLPFGSSIAAVAKKD